MKFSMCAAVLGVSAAVAVGGEWIRPITSPTLVDSPEVGTSIHPIVIHQVHPDKLDTTLGRVPAGGDFQVYAVQFEYAFNGNLSLIAVKDGYIDFNPDETLSKEEGFADLAAGLKYVFKRTEDCVASAKLVVELPTGDDEVWQGNGKGAIDPAVAFAKKNGAWQFNGTLGGVIALDDERSTMLYDSWHLSYAATPKFFPLVELNHMYVLDAGDGGKRFDVQAAGGVPSIAKFEGGDLVNFGASNADENEHFVSLAVGARYRLSESIDLGAAYEIPLTEKEASLMEYRVTVDLVWRL
ncbi:MAG TPA: hypothetical protein PKE12_15905 [Kiritimatiellia bacterium]|nr:hypothetical protein [Kiritimatiellia bacterium]